MVKRIQKPTLDTVADKAALHARRISLLAQDELLESLSGIYGSADFQTIVTIARDVLNKYDPLLASVMSQAELAAWVLGVSEVVKGIPPAITDELGGIRVEKYRDDSPIDNRPPLKREESGDEPKIELTLIDHAVDDILSRGVLKRKDFDKLSDDLKREAFTVAWQNSEDTIKVIRDVAGEATRKGWDLRRFRNELEAELGTSPLSQWHSELVFRQTIQTGYANGQEKIASHPVVKPLFPFAKIAPINDSRVRKTHLSLAKSGLEEGPIYWADDPMWRIFTPPIEWNCRCAKTFLSIRQAAQAGLKLAQQWLETGVEPEHEWRLDFIEWRPDPTFAGGLRKVG